MNGTLRSLWASLSPHATARIKEACDRFQRAWTEGDKPCVEEYLAAESEPERLALMHELLVVERRHRERTDNPLTPEDAHRRFPDHSELVDSVFTSAGGSITQDVTSTQPPPDETSAPTEDFLASTIDYSRSEAASDTATDAAALRDQDSAESPSTIPSDPRSEGLAPIPEGIPPIADYEMLGLLGRGGMGMVLKARDRRLERIVAIKMPLSPDDEYRKRFLREARASAGLRHANICPIHEVGEADGWPYLVMDYIQGCILRELAAEDLPAERSTKIVAKLARAVDYAHQHDVVHRDLKPSNVMIDAETGEPILMDFGLAKPITGDSSLMTQSGQVIGTPAYMPPEQATGEHERVGPRSDIYSLGAILYYLLSGHSPFAGSVAEVLGKVCNQEPVALRKLQPRTHRDLETICSKAMAKESRDRYVSASALADDLDRFRAGEAILAKREGLARKAWRRVRRHPITAVLVLLVIVAIATAGFVAVRAQRITGLRRSIDQRLASEPYSRHGIEDLETLIGRLGRYDAEEADTYRDRLYESFAKSIEEAIGKPRLDPEATKRIQDSLDLLNELSPQRAAVIADRLAKLQSDWQVEFELKPPFDDVEATFGPDTVRAEGGRLLSTGGLVRTTCPCPSEVRLEAQFDASWTSAERLGLVLGAGAPDTNAAVGYSFFVLPPRANSRKSAKTKDEPDAPSGDVVRVQIFRGQVVLREEDIPLPAGPLSLSASRSLDRLTFQVNHLPPLKSRDVFPLPQNDARVLAVQWPDRVPLILLRASTRRRPAEESPLERGEHLYGLGRFADAMHEFQQQATLSRGTEFGKEASVKQALCLIALERMDEATEILGVVANEEGNRWPLIAGCQLWSIRLQQRRPDEAYAAFLALSSRYAFNQLREQVPRDLVASIVEQYREKSGGLGWYSYNPDLIQNLERSIAVQQFFGVEGLSLDVPRLYLCRAYHLKGDNRTAIFRAERILREQTSFHGENQHRFLQLCELYSWLLRLEGEAPRALSILDQQLLDSDGQYRADRLALLVERARVHTALEQWEDAEKDLTTLLSRSSATELGYARHSGCCLLLGCLRDRRGDREGALSAWRDGGMRRTPEHSALKLRDVEGFAHALVLASLGEQFTADDINWLIQKVSKGIAASHRIPPSVIEGTVRIFLVDLTPARIAGIVQETFRGPRGRQVAEHWAFRDQAMHELTAQFIDCLFTELVDQLLIPDKLSPEQQALASQFAAGAYAAYYEGRFDKSHLMQMVMVWNGLTGLGGWQALAPKLDADMRGPAAYFFGHRYLQLDRQSVAVEFWKAALEDAPADSDLGRLCRAELDRIAPEEDDGG